MSVAELDFVEMLESSAFVSATSIYTVWQDVMARLTEEYEKVYGMNALGRALHFIFKRLGRRFRKRK